MTPYETLMSWKEQREELVRLLPLARDEDLERDLSTDIAILEEKISYWEGRIDDLKSN